MTKRETGGNIFTINLHVRHRTLHKLSVFIGYLYLTCEISISLVLIFNQDSEGVPHERSGVPHERSRVPFSPTLSELPHVPTFTCQDHNVLATLNSSVAILHMFCMITQSRYSHTHPPFLGSPSPLAVARHFYRLFPIMYLVQEPRNEVSCESSILTTDEKHT